MFFILLERDLDGWPQQVLWSSTCERHAGLIRDALVGHFGVLLEGGDHYARRTIISSDVRFDVVYRWQVFAERASTVLDAACKRPLTPSLSREFAALRNARELEDYPDDELETFVFAAAVQEHLQRNCPGALHLSTLDQATLLKACLNMINAACNTNEWDLVQSAVSLVLDALSVTDLAQQCKQAELKDLLRLANAIEARRQLLLPNNRPSLPESLDRDAVVLDERRPIEAAAKDASSATPARGETPPRKRLTKKQIQFAARVREAAAYIQKNPNRTLKEIAEATDCPLSSFKSRVWKHLRDAEGFTHAPGFGVHAPAVVSSATE